MTKLVPDKSLSFCLTENHENFINSWLKMIIGDPQPGQLQTWLLASTANINRTAKDKFRLGSLMLISDLRHLDRTRPGATR